MQETLVRFLGQEDPLEKEMANGNPFQYSCLENPMDRGVPGRPQSKESTVHGVASKFAEGRDQTFISQLLSTGHMERVDN